MRIDIEFTRALDPGNFLTNGRYFLRPINYGLYVGQSGAEWVEVENFGGADLKSTGKFEISSTASNRFADDPQRSPSQRLARFPQMRKPHLPG